MVKLHVPGGCTGVESSLEYFPNHYSPRKTVKGADYFIFSSNGVRFNFYKIFNSKGLSWISGKMNTLIHEATDAAGTDTDAVAVVVAPPPKFTAICPLSSSCPTAAEGITSISTTTCARGLS